MKKILIIISIILFILLSSFIIFQRFFLETESFLKMTKAEPKKLSLLLLGDIFLNQNIITDGIYQLNNYNFEYIFEDVEENFEGYDIMHYFQKNIITNATVYNNFRAPNQIAENMMNYGFNLISLANSNIARSSYIDDSVDFWENKDVVVSGFKEKNNVHTINDVTYAFFSYTTEEGNKINYYNKDKVEEELSDIREKVDLIIVSIDWKESYNEEPSEKQEKIAKELANMGANVIIGSNSSNIKPVEVIDNTIVFYSLGNFLVDNNNDFSISAVSRLDLSIFENNVNFDFVKIDLSYAYSDNGSNFKVDLFNNLDDTILDGYKTYYTKYSEILKSKKNDIIITKIGD